MNERSARLSGMTINERLSHGGLMEQWDTAARRRDRIEMIRLFREVEVAEPDETVDAVLANPTKFGF